MKHFEEFIKKHKILYGVSGIVMSIGILCRICEWVDKWASLTLAFVGLFGTLIFMTLYIIDVIKESKK